MSSEYTPVDTLHTTVTIPSDGDAATASNFNAGTKDNADNTQAIRNGVEHIASPQSLTTSRGILDGVKRIRSVTSFANLSSLVVGSVNDHELCAVVGGDGESSGYYIYEHGSADAIFSPFVLNAASSTGRWKWMGNSLFGLQPGIPFVDATGLLTNVALINQNLIDNRIIKIEAIESGEDDENPSSSLATSSNNTFAEGFTQVVSGLAVGDKLLVRVNVHARASRSAGGTGFGVIGLFIDDDAKATAIIDRDDASSESTTGFIRQYSLECVFTASATSHEIEIKVRGNTTPSTIDGDMFEPIHGSVTVIRP